MAPLTRTIKGVQLTYEESDNELDPTIVMLTGWAHDLRLYEEMIPLLVPPHHIIRMNWRGHGYSRDKVPDFGVEEQAEDVIALLDALDVDRFYLVSHSHGGWPALELVRRLGKGRISGLLMIDQIMTSPPQPFMEAMQQMQDRSTWRRARKTLFDDWLAGSDNKAVREHLQYCMSSYGFDMWSMSCRVIANEYKTHGSPFALMATLEDPPPICHVFSHPKDNSEYRLSHDHFSTSHSWFSYKDIGGVTHFPDLENPEAVVKELEGLMSKNDIETI